MKRMTYKQLGKKLGDYIEQPVVSLSDGGQGYIADAVFACRILVEDKEQAKTLTLARKELTCYFTEMRRARKPDRELKWLGLATDLRKEWWTRTYADGRPTTPWVKTSPQELPGLAPGPLDAKFTETEKLIWDNPNIHHAEDGTLVKTCTRCGKDKMLGGYHVDRHSKDGLRNNCTDCRNPQERERQKVQRARRHKKKEDANATSSAH